MTYKELTKREVGETHFSNLEKYVALIEKYNKKMNLTGFTGDKLWEEGIYESIISLKQGFNGENKFKLLCDVGAGAGFPSVPFIIANPDIRLLILEPQKKRTKFLEIVKEELRLKMTISNSRAEEYDGRRASHVTARAVADLPTLIEITSQLGLVNTRYAFIKGPRVFEEQKVSKWILDELKIKLDIHKIATPQDKEIYVARYKSTYKTPDNFPRDFSVIKKSNKKLMKKVK